MNTFQLTPLMALCGLIWVASCASTDVEQEQEERRRLSMERFRALVDTGSTLTPLDMGDDNAERAKMEKRLVEWNERRVVGSGTSESEALLDGPLSGTDGLEDEWNTDLVEEINPYVEFGPRILVHQDENGEPTGLITKPYSVRPGMGEKIIELLMAYGDFAIWDPETGAQQLGTLRAESKPGFELEQFAQDLRSLGPDLGPASPISDWVVVTADHETLGNFEYFLDVMFAGPPQIEIKATIIEVVETDTTDIGVGPADSGAPIIGLPDHVLFDNINWSFPNQSGGSEFITSIGTVHDGASFNFMLELLKTHEKIDIISEPMVVVREGARAMIESTQMIPYYQIAGIDNSGGVNATLNYHEVGVRLYAIPRLIGGSTISLEIDVEASQQVGNEVSFITTTGEAITTPTLGFRKSNTLVYLKPGQAVALGGLKTTRQVEDTKKVPFLGDVPVLGALFRSKYTREEEVNVLFVLEPRILTGSDLNRNF